MKCACVFTNIQRRHLPSHRVDLVIHIDLSCRYQCTDALNIAINGSAVQWSVRVELN